MTRSSRTVYKNSESLAIKLAQKGSKIDKIYQEQINFLLKKNNLGPLIEEDGDWGKSTQESLNKIQSYFKLSPFDSIDSLSQLTSIIQSDFNPENKSIDVNQQESPLIYMLQSDQIINYLVKFEEVFNNFIKYINSPVINTKNANTEQSINYYNSIISYVQNMMWYVNILSKIEVFSSNFLQIKSILENMLQRQFSKLDFMKKIQSAESAQNKELVSKLEAEFDSFNDKSKSSALSKEDFRNKISTLLQNSKRIVNL